MVMGIPGINLPNLTMLPESIRPIKNRIDESLGMRRGPERDFKQTLADRRDESIGASLGRYGEPGLPSLAPRKTIPRATKDPRMNKLAEEVRELKRAGIDAPVMPSATGGINYDELFSPIPVQEKINKQIADFIGSGTAPVMPSGPQVVGHSNQDQGTGNFVWRNPDGGYTSVSRWKNVPANVRHRVYGSKEDLAISEGKTPMTLEEKMQPLVDQLLSESGQPDPVTTTAPVFPSITTEPGTDTVGPPGTTISPIQEAVNAAVGGGTGNKYGFTPGDPTKMYPQVMVPWVNKETGESYTAPNPGYQPPPGSAWEEAGYGGIPGFNQPDPVQEAVDAAVGGGTKPFPSDQYGKWGHPIKGTPAYQAMLDKVNAMSDKELFSYLHAIDHPYQSFAEDRFRELMQEGLGPRIGSDPMFDAEGGYQGVGPIGGDAEPGVAITDPVQEAVDAAVGGGAVDDYSNLPPGVKPGGRYFTDPITGNPMYQPPMPDVGPGQMQAMVMPPAIDLTTGKPSVPTWDFDFNQPPPPVPEGGIPQADPVQEAVDAAVGGETPVADEVPFMDQLQAMVDQILAQQAEQQTAQQQAQQQQAQQAQNYTLSGSRIGYNPYTSGQYQADPYGAAGVPDMGGLTTIPVPQPLTGIGYANYQAPENMT